jgi:protein-tyrosine-phosphatase
MAEGWARKWISDQLEILGSTVQFNNNDDDDVSSGNDKESLSSTNHRDTICIQEKLAILNNTIVVSVALDSSSVFKNSSNDDLASPLADTNNVSLYRKQVKSKAVEAMKKEGIDIASHQPKTVDEIMHVIRNDGVLLPESLPMNKRFVANIETLTKESDQECHNMEETSTQKTVDKLIVLCSCGEMNDKLLKCSKSIEEWHIDAPTAASKAGEGDMAYRRVSLQIKDEVNNLMERLVGYPF